MRAALIRSVGTAPEYVEEVEEPTARSSDVLVAPEMVAVNAIDLAIANGGVPLPPSPLPYVPGREGVGKVLSPGPLEGRRVWFEAPGGLGGNGSMAERALTNREIMVEIPDEVTSEVAARYGISGTAAWLSLQWRGQIQRGETVLVLGASGVVGQIAVQAAKYLGAGRVVAAARSVDDARLFRDADAVVPLDDSLDLAAQLQDAANGRIDLIIDPLWGSPAIAAIEAANDGARLVQMGSSASAKADLAGFLLRPQTYLATHISGRNISILGHTNMAVPTSVRADAYRHLIAAVASGDIDVPGMTYPLDRVADAFRAQQQSAHQKIVIAI
jgi:NADPH:quinone reductase-like Zn-dependent oxidoreductase